jgi:malate/lactate dehydrogenase
MESSTISALILSSEVAGTITIVGRNGVEGAVPIRLNEQEKDALLKSSETLKAVIDESL